MRAYLTFTALAALAAGPALAAPGGGAFFSMQNPTFNVALGFILFVSLLLFLKVPRLIRGMLSKRAEGIRGDLDEARALREEAQALLSSYERKQKEVQTKAEEIVAHARKEAELASRQANADLEASIARRLAAAEEQIQSAQAAAIREVRDSAVQVAIAAAGDVIAASMTASQGDRLIDEAIEEAGARLH